MEPGHGFARAKATLTNSTNERPWESAPVPDVEHLYECAIASGWHDEAYYSGDDLYWYEGEEKYPAAWMCSSCHYHIRTDRYGLDSPEANGTFPYLETIPSLAQEIERRLGEGMWEWRPLQATHK